MLRIENLSVGFTPDKLILDRLNLSLSLGGRLALVGSSGAGKTLLVKTLLGMLPPEANASGNVIIDNKDLTLLTKREWQLLRRHTLGYIPQDSLASLDPCFTVMKQISDVVVSSQELPGRAAREETLALLDQVGFPDPPVRAQSFPHQLSGGLRQRVLIAMALAHRPKLLIADEPTTGLDPAARQAVLDQLASLQAAYGFAFLLITHDLRHLERLSTEIAVLEKGRIVERGEWSQIRYFPNHPSTRAFVEASERMGRPR